MIEVKNLKKGFDGKEVISGVNAVFEPGKCNLIIGSSGSGKTVLMKCLVGLFEPDSGDISYSGKDFTSYESRRTGKYSASKSECCSRVLHFLTA